VAQRRFETIALEVKPVLFFFHTDEPGSAYSKEDWKVTLALDAAVKPWNP
jgi:hypothetical protein